MAPAAGYRTRRAQLAVATTVAIAALVLAVVALVPAKTQLAYTNNLLVLGLVAEIAPRAELCREDVVLPSDTGGVRLFVYTRASTGPPLELTATTGREVFRGRARGGYSDSSYLTIPFPPTARDLKATICLKNVGESVVGFGGAGNPDLKVSKLKVNGKPVGADVVVQAVRPDQSLLKTVPAITRRASIWAPSFVGPWTFYLVLLLMVGAGAVGVRLTLASR